MIKITKKHYKLIAEWFKKYVSGADCCPDHNPAILAAELTVMLQLDNPRFDRTKFLKACGITA